MTISSVVGDPSLSDPGGSRLRAPSGATTAECEDSAVLLYPKLLQQNSAPAERCRDAPRHLQKHLLLTRSAPMLDCFSASLTPTAKPHTGCTEQDPFFVCLLLAACKIHGDHRAGRSVSASRSLTRLLRSKRGPAATASSRADVPPPPAPGRAELMFLLLGIKLQTHFLQVDNKLPEILAFRWWFLLLLSHLELCCRSHLAPIASGFPFGAGTGMERLASG